MIQATLDFDGASYVREFDHTRLTGQLAKVYNLMKDGRWRTLGEIESLIDEPQASISARLRDFRKPRFNSHTVDRRPRGDRENGLFEYRLTK